MKVKDILNQKLPNGGQCLWQIVPSEIPEDMRPMALELHTDQDGKQHFFHFFIDADGDGRWYDNVEAFAHFVQE